MDPNEAVGVEPPLEDADLLANEMLVVANVERQVVARGLNVVDVVDCDEDRRSTRLHADAPKILRPKVALGEQRAQALAELAHPAALDARPSPVDGDAE